MSGSSPPEPGEEQVFVADSVDEFVQRTRWKQILEAREHAANALDIGHRERENRAQGMSTAAARRTAVRAARTAVETYILECEPMFRRTVPGEKLWADTEIATIPARRLFPTPSADSDWWEFDSLDAVEIMGDTPIECHRPDRTQPRENPGSGGGGGDDVTQEVIEALNKMGAPPRRSDPDPAPIKLTLNGVRDYLELPNTRVHIEYTVCRPSANRSGKEDRETTAKLRVPVRLTREAYRATNALLNHIDTGVEIGVGGNAVENDYSDLLDKIDE